jgi:hypothetical protein
VPKAVLSNRTVPGTTRLVNGAPARSSRPAIDGRRSDIVGCAPVEVAVKCCSLSLLRSLRFEVISQRSL